MTMATADQIFRFGGAPWTCRWGRCAALFGAVLLLASDLLARTLLPPQELPIGIITSSLGAFFVVTMLIRNRL